MLNSKPSLFVILILFCLGANPPRNSVDPSLKSNTPPDKTRDAAKTFQVTTRNGTVIDFINEYSQKDLEQAGLKMSSRWTHGILDALRQDLELRVGRSKARMSSQALIEMYSAPRTLMEVYSLSEGLMQVGWQLRPEDQPQLNEKLPDCLIETVVLVGKHVVAIEAQYSGVDRTSDLLTRFGTPVSDNPLTWKWKPSFIPRGRIITYGREPRTWMGGEGKLKNQHSCAFSITAEPALADIATEKTRILTEMREELKKEKEKHN